MKTPPVQYAQFTFKERIRLALAAFERGDIGELDRLFRSCPTVTRDIPDPRFTSPLLAMKVEVSMLLILWLEVSARILMLSLFHDNIPAEDIVGTRKAKAAWKEMCTIWRGIEAGIEEFCAEAGLTSAQLLDFGGGRPELVDVAGQELQGNARVNREIQEAARQRLSWAWEIGDRSRAELYKTIYQQQGEL